MQRWWIGGLAGLLVAAGLSAAPAASALAPPTTTSLLLSTAESAYGQTVTATATVAARPGPAEGDVVFSVDNRQLKANLAASGSATIVLPTALVGSHPITATFVPQFPDSQEGSSASQVWTVVPVRSRLQVRVIGKGARIPTSVQVKAAGEYGTRPTGRVKVVVRRTGTRDSTRVVTRLSSTAVALAELGKLRKGRYRLEVTYVGDSQHLREVHVERFYVRRR